MKDIIKPGFILMIIAIISASSLAYINSITEPLIMDNRVAKVKVSLQEIFPQAENFDEVDGNYIAYLNKEKIGTIKKVTSPGYSSVLEFMVGIDLDGKIVGVIVLNQVETPGLGANVEKSTFLDQFNGKSQTQSRLKSEGGTIDAMTGATITSKAATVAIQKAFENN